MRYPAFILPLMLLFFSVLLTETEGKRGNIYAQNSVQNSVQDSLRDSIRDSIRDSVQNFTQNSEPDSVIEVNREIDAEKVPGVNPDWKAGAFSVAMRFRPLEAGSNTTSENGMLFACGSGWFDGFRAYYDYGKDSTVHFQVGRAKEQSAVEAVSKTEIRFGTLHDLVCTYDGAVLKLYLDGELESETAFSEGLSPRDAPLAVGFGGYGIGSVRMFVSRAEYWRRALTAEEVTARYAEHPEEEKAKIALWKEVKLVYKLEDFSISLENLEKVAAMEDVPYGLRETFLDRLLNANEWEKAMTQLEEMTRQALAREIPQEESVYAENERLSDLFTLFAAWEKIPEPVFTPERKTLRENFLEKYAKEYAVLVKIHALDTQMCDRTHKIEALALREWGEVCAAAKNRTLKQDASVRTFHLAPDGCDENPGTAARPFRSLKRALTEALTLQKQGVSTEIRIADGFYFCTEKTEIKNEKQNMINSGTNSDSESDMNSGTKPESGTDSESGTKFEEALSATVYVHPEAGARPVFTYGQTLRGFQRVTDPAILARLPENAREQVRVASLLRNGITDFGTLGDRGYPVFDEMNPWTDVYVNGEALTMARYPNDGEEELSIGEVIPGPRATEKDPDSGTFRCGDTHAASWKWPENPEENDIWAYGLWTHEYASHTVKVKGFNAAEKLLTVDAKTNGKFTYHFLNVLEELDRPGEFYLDRKNGLVYIFPPKDVNLNEAQVEFPMTEGTFLRLENVRNVILEGLSFVCTRGTALRFEECENVYVNHSVLARCGIHGLIINGGRACGIFGSEIHSVGSCGVRLTGGNRDTLEPCGHFVTNCLIHDFCRVDRSYAPAVHCIGVGILMTNNLIYDSPHHAFRTEGNDLLIARNEVHSVVYDFSDQSGIDIYCDPTFRGIVIRDNFWHHIGSKLAICGQAGIRLDDSISGVVMKGNVFYRSSGGFFGGIQVHGGKDNLISENLFLDCRIGISFSPWENNRYRETFLDAMFPQHIEPYTKMGVYPFMEEIREHINRNYVLNNEFAQCGTFIGNGNGRRELCAGNRSFMPVSELPLEENGLASPQALREWVETLPGHSLKHIGLQPSPLFTAGQKGVKHSVSPHYYSEKTE